MHRQLLGTVSKFVAAEVNPHVKEWEAAEQFPSDVSVPASNAIGEPGMGFQMQMMQFLEERLWAAASALPALDRMIDATIDYCRERATFRQRLIENQVIHFRLAELRTEVEMLRSLTWRAVEDYVAGRDVVKLASMAKLKTGRHGREVADAWLQDWGGMGYTEDNMVSRFYRDGRLWSIGGGADEIMLGVICRREGTLPPRTQ